MATAMTCSQCWTTVPSGKAVCPRCGAKVTGAPPSFTGLLKSYPWLAVLLTVSLLLTVWAATRRPPAPVPIPPSVEPAPTAAVAPAAEEPQTELAPPPMPIAEPAPEPAATVRPARADEPLSESPDGSFRGPALTKPN